MNRALFCSSDARRRHGPCRCGCIAGQGSANMGLNMSKSPHLTVMDGGRDRQVGMGY